MAVDHLAEFRNICAPLFSGSAFPGEQLAAAHQLFDLLSGIAGYDDTAPSQIEVTDIFLPTGKAIAFQGAARCLWEYARTSKFLRGVEAALREAQRRFPGQRLRLLEAGCGPFALLALPLACRFASDEVGFTLLDVHEGSLDAARRIVEALGLADYVDEYVRTDAASWRCPEEKRPHVVVSETMQNALKNEPQLAITRNLAPQRLPGGLFLPEAVALDFSLLTHHRDSNEVSLARSHPVASVFELTPDNPEAPLSGRITLPTPLPCNAFPAICTRIRVYGDICLDENECSLTIPVPIKTLPVLLAGQVLDYEYLCHPQPRMHFSTVATG